MAYIDFITCLHKKTKRNYLDRVIRDDKAYCSGIAKKFDKDYWDGDRKYGYGGFNYDGRWIQVAKNIIDYYKIKPGDRILDVGCGKGCLTYDLMIQMNGVEVFGIDISRYALRYSIKEIQPFLALGKAQQIPFRDNYFDLVISITTLHNLYIYDMENAVKEIERVKKHNSYIVVESYRNEQEKANLLNWQLTCECFFTPDEWIWLYKEFNYSGDFSFIYFE